MKDIETYEQKRDTQRSKLITIIEDDLIIQNSILRYFELVDDFKSGINCNSAEEYFEELVKYPDYKPDIILLDIGLPGMSGLDAIPNILKHSPQTNIIMLTTFEEENKVLRAMCTGAVAYLSKKTSLKKIVETIRIVDGGGSYMSPNIARDIFKFMMYDNAKPEEPLLSDRQTEVLKSIVDGKTYKQIAESLFISPNTVRTHFKNIYRILHVNNKAEAIAKYLNGQLYR